MVSSSSSGAANGNSSANSTPVKRAQLHNHATPYRHDDGAGTGAHQKQSKFASQMGLMILDGLGLAIIAGCTVLEGVDLWRDYFNEYYDVSNMNKVSMFFLLGGKTCQVMGLFALISHAISFQLFHSVEWSGMAMLTAGPVLNIIANSLFDSGNDGSYLYNRQWLSSESLELVGIVILDLSLIDMEEVMVLLAEVIGFFILALASVVDFEYSADSRGSSLITSLSSATSSLNSIRAEAAAAEEAEACFPCVSLRLDPVHASDCVGLGILTLVAVIQYKAKLASKHHA